MAANGNILLVKLGGVTIAGVKSSEQQSSCEMIETASPNSGRWKTYIAGRKGWNVTLNYLLADANNIKDLLKVGVTYELYFIHRNAPVPYCYGTATLTTCKITATTGQLMQGSFQFLGNGELQEYTQ